MVLSISEREGEDSGNTEAFGVIADCYTEFGDLEKAATFYACLKLVFISKNEMG
ncbi:putative tetratricopeptide-like helical domain superfamily [Helianthus anomalus]